MAALSGGTVTILYLVVSVLVLALWILVAALVGKAAERKLRSFWSFFLIALFISPLLGAVIVATNATRPCGGIRLTESGPHSISFAVPSGCPTMQIAEPSLPVVPPTKLIPGGATR